MKELHFYVQSILILLALAIGLQEPFLENLDGTVILIQFFLGVYQYGMSWFLMLRLRRGNVLLLVYFCLVPVYLLVLIFGSNGYINWWDDSIQQVMLYVIPWGLAIYFLVVIEELLRKKPVKV